MCSISRDPRWEDWTICTAVAPDAVLTVRTHGPGAAWLQRGDEEVRPARDHLRLALTPPVHVVEHPLRAGHRARPQPVADIDRQPDRPSGQAGSGKAASDQGSRAISTRPALTAS